MAVKYIVEYEDGVEVNQVPYEVPDGELVIEAIEAETAEANDNALIAYQNFDDLTLAQKNRILKGLLGDFISRHRDNYI